MSRRHLNFVVVAIASLVVGACSAAPTGPRPSATSHDTFTAPVDSSGLIGTSGGHG